MVFGPRSRFLRFFETGIGHHRSAFAARQVADIQSLDSRRQVIKRPFRGGASKKQPVVFPRVPGKDYNARHPLQYDGQDIQRRAVLVPDAEPRLSRREIRQRNSQVLLELVFDFETVDIRRSGASPDSFSVPPVDLRPALEVFLGNRGDTGVGMRIRLIDLKL